MTNVPHSGWRAFNGPVDSICDAEAAGIAAYIDGDIEIKDFTGPLSYDSRKKCDMGCKALGDTHYTTCAAYDPDATVKF